MHYRHFTSVIQSDGDWFVSWCPELDIASQGKTVEEARQNLVEALELFFEAASPAEIDERLHQETFITQVGVRVA